MAEKKKSTETAEAEAKEGTEVEVKTEPTEVAETGGRKGALAPLLDFDREFERAFENFFNRGWLRAPRWEFPKLQGVFGDKTPNVNVIDRDNEVVVEAELPGIDKDDVDVTLSENTVTIKASTRKEEEEEKGEYHRREISSGYYSRTLPLPAVVEGDKAKAEFKDGLLRLTLPKSEQSKRISIKVD